MQSHFQDDDRRFGRRSDWRSAFLPKLCSLVVVLAPSFLFLPVHTALAQSREATEAAGAAGAAAHWKEGARAFTAGDCELAQREFEQAYALRPDPALLQNLGEAELRCGHDLAAAQHLTDYLASSAISPERRARAKASLASALARVGRLVLLRDGPQDGPRDGKDDFTALVDGKPIGATAATEAAPLLLEPGHHVVATGKRGLPMTEIRVDIEAGQESSVRLVPLVPPAVASPVSPSSARPAASQAQAVVTVPASVTGGGWSPRTTTVIVGSGIAAAAIGLGACLSLSYASNEHRIDELQTTISGRGISCGSSGTPGTGPECDELAAKRRDRRAYFFGATGSFVAAGMAGVATVLLYIYGPQGPRDKARDKVLDKARVEVAPLVGDRMGAAIWGQF